MQGAAKSSAARPTSRNSAAGTAGPARPTVADSHPETFPQRSPAGPNRRKTPITTRKALLRIAALYNIPTACNRATADFIASSPLMADEYERRPLDTARSTRVDR